MVDGRVSSKMSLAVRRQITGTKKKALIRALMKGVTDFFLFFNTVRTMNGFLLILLICFFWITLSSFTFRRHSLAYLYFNPKIRLAPQYNCSALPDLFYSTLPLFFFSPHCHHIRNYTQMIFHCMSVSFSPVHSNHCLSMLMGREK